MYIGIDGGGTKTKMVSYDDGNICQEIVLPTVHILSQTPKKCIEILKAGVEQLDPQSVSKIGIGLAGYGQDKKIRKEIEDICLKAFKNRPFVLKSDVQIAIEGALDGQDGIVVIAGTGSIALSLKEGMLQRCGGWGYQLGDEGSAYWIAKKMLNVFCQEVDGRLEKTILYDLIKRECHLVNDYDIITFMNNLNHDRTKIAALAYINGLAAKEKDPNALKIYKQAAEEIYKLINLLSKNFKSPINVSYIGGVFQHAGSFIIPHLQDQLGNRFNLIPPIHTPEYGAYILAKKLR
ncbi:N-acetylglucosamine kinase [Faecalibacillus intestinalis]|uniref:N-acetylglucosamine kinase n=1 Tax=Faecalibacillus intestinalis TaxID=1982626 RepID=UPI0022E43759|nr:BadF/BadG/BcrA/BcrD ATPase family protein [Faecalibacillus intestinalis]